MFKKFYCVDLDKNIFLTAIFLLPSAPFFSFFLLLLTLIIGLRKNYKEIISNPWNYPFMLVIFLMPLVVFFQNKNHYNEVVFDKSLSWIGLGNWVPLFFLFLALQCYLNSPEKRLTFGKVLLAGSVPVLITGIGQYFFNWHGPLETLNGLIIWFQRPIEEGQGLSGLFNNQNYAGAWLCLIWPFALSIFLENYKKFFNRLITLAFLTLITVTLILTTSRNAWGGLILLIPLMTGISGLYILLPIILLTAFILFLTLSNQAPLDIQNTFREILPNSIWQLFTSEYYSDRISRLEIWWTAIKFILEKPLLGWGGASFPVIYYYAKNAELRHSHNLAIELAVSYGLFSSLIVFLTLLLIIIFGFKKIFSTKKYYPFEKLNLHDRAWFSSFLVLFLTQMFDVQYFDGRISVMFWLLAAGLIQVISDKKIIPPN